MDSAPPIDLLKTALTLPCILYVQQIHHYSILRSLAFGPMVSRIETSFSSHCTSSCPDVDALYERVLCCTVPWWYDSIYLQKPLQHRVSDCQCGTEIAAWIRTVRQINQHLFQKDSQMSDTSHRCVHVPITCELHPIRMDAVRTARCMTHGFCSVQITLALPQKSWELCAPHNEHLLGAHRPWGEYF